VKKSRKKGLRVDKLFNCSIVNFKGISKIKFLLPASFLGFYVDDNIDNVDDIDRCFRSFFTILLEIKNHLFIFFIIISNIYISIFHYSYIFVSVITMIFAFVSLYFFNNFYYLQIFQTKKAQKLSILGCID
jgi:hypothetical protein